MALYYPFPPARAYPLNKCLFALKSDAAFRRQFLADPAQALRAFPLDAEERQALLAGDAERLVALGAHPYLVFMARLRLDMEQQTQRYTYF
ncbi:MAG: hypothetical protein KatS3mg131_1742 [Candidatus Tectimicrobiota bacterium]|nr:MAG: hypothetical protein KatS3mg131_1742 [Candidatus Tectomicrobia bacterium]